MSSSNKDLEHAILSYLSSFEDLSHKAEDFGSLSDGITLTEFMHHIDPSLFDISKINKETQDNWALRLNNLDYLHEKLETYYTTILNKDFNKSHVDILKVSKNDNQESLYDLVELVIGAAVQCPDKEVYINKILALDEGDQNALMDLIEKILHQINPEERLETDPETPMDNQAGRSSQNAFSLASKFEAQEKKLLTKLEELENDNQNMNLKYNDMLIEKEHMHVRVNELLQELNKKTEEVNKLLQDREEIQEKVQVQDSIEELKNELKLKDMKMEQLQEYMEELKETHHHEVLKLEEEINKQKKRVEQLSKLEGTLDFYKSKYQDYSVLTGKMGEFENEVEKYKIKIEELTKTNESLTVKMNTFKEKLEAEKTTNISLDIELTKKKTEIEGLKSDKRRLEASNNDLEAKIQEQHRNMEKQMHEREDTARHYASTDLAMNALADNLHRFNNSGDENAIKDTSAQHEGEREILQQENDILKAKCKEIQIENENLKASKNAYDRLNSEHLALKKELEEVRKGKPSSGNSGVSSPGTHGSDHLQILREEVSEKTRMIGQLSDEMVTLKSSSQKSQKKLEDDLARKDDEIKELNEELSAMKSIITEVGDQKEEELKILAAAVQELALRNLNLEKQVQVTAGGSGNKENRV